MILYLDTSALLKRYFQEPFSEEVLSKWDQSEAIVTSAVAYAETMATIYRKKKESGLKKNVVQNIVNAFQKDWSGIIHVGVTEGLNEIIDKLVITHSLRGFDVIHLASALVVYEKLPEGFFFACFEQRLNQAARFEGLMTFSCV